MSQLEKNHPYVLELTVTIESNTLVFASTQKDAAEILEDRWDELKAHLIETAGLPKEGEPGHEFLTFNSEARQAMGYEVQGTAALLPTLPELHRADECRCDHADEEEEDHRD